MRDIFRMRLIKKNHLVFTHMNILNSFEDLWLTAVINLNSLVVSSWRKQTSIIRANVNRICRCCQETNKNDRVSIINKEYFYLRAE